MQVVSAPANIRGFDCNAVVSEDIARSFVAHGYRFIARYLPRVTQAAHDLTASEVQHLLAAGLAVMPVQHVAHEDWIPDAATGAAYGRVAALSASACNILLGTSVWLDLEGVKTGVDAETVIAYCNAWFDEVAQVGFLPGIYVGWHDVLTPDQLYRRLKFTRYWSAYNLDGDRVPAVVGVCMKQGEAKILDYPVGFHRDGNGAMQPFEIDTDLILGDAKGRTPVVTAPDAWDVCG